MPLGMEVGLGPGDLMCSMTTQLPPPEKKGTSLTQFFAHVYCGQTARWIKMPLGTEINVGPGDIMLDEDPAPPMKGAQQPPPLFSADVYCGHGHPSQLLLSSCQTFHATYRQIMS